MRTESLTTHKDKMPSSIPRLNTRLESEGAEFLVLGQLLIAKVATYKTYTNMPGYDLVATNTETNRAAKIQVKSRWRTGAPGFLIKNVECDFVVFCRLNRGHKDGLGAVLDPEYFVLPASVVRMALNTDTAWSKVYVRDIKDLETYRNRWDLVREFLAPVKTRKKRVSRA